MGKYSAEDHVLADIIAEIKVVWSCKQKLHETCVDVQNSHVQLHRLRMREWASRIVSSLTLVLDGVHDHL